MLTPTISSSIPTWKRDRYLEAVKVEAFRIAVKNHGRLEADDIVQDVLVKLWGRLDETMTAYPDPVVYARAVCRNSGIDHLRRQKSQRGSGARGGRDVISGDAPDAATGLSYFDTRESVGDDIADEVIAALENDYRWAEIQMGVPPREFEAMRLTFLDGYTDAEAGDIMGVTRESVNRWKNNGKRRLQELLS